MKLATLDDGTRDGALFVTDGERALSAAGLARTMRDALDDWVSLRPELLALERRLLEGEGTPVEAARLRAPLPRTYEWIDGSAYLSHVLLARRSRGAPPPPRLRDDPLVYQGGGGRMLGPNEPLEVLDEAFGLDFEAELGVILRDVPRGVDAAHALEHVALVVLLNDVTYRGLVPAELEKGFGFLQSKPPTAFAPFAVTPDSLGASFRDGRLAARVRTMRNDEVFGDVDAAREMHFSFAALIAHAARTRPLVAGTILGSGTIASEDPSVGSSCIVERRMRETLENGSPTTPYLGRGERIAIEAFDSSGASIFGRIAQEVVDVAPTAHGRSRTDTGARTRTDRQ